MVYLVNSAAELSIQHSHFINIHFRISHQSASLDLSATCIAVSLINGHWLKIRPHATIVLIEIHPSPWTRYHATVQQFNPKPVDLFSPRLVNQNRNGPNKGSPLYNFGIQCWSEKKVCGVDYYPPCWSVPLCYSCNMINKIYSA